MADKSLCKIDGCGKPSHARGWCRAHYQRWWLHGDPTAGGPIGTSPGELRRYLREVVLPYNGEDCLPWPYSRTSEGYGVINFGGSNKVVARIVCEAEHGPPPAPKLDAAHSCGNGHLGCVSRRHLSWKTRTENMADTIQHGTRARGERLSKITEATARAILALDGEMSKAAIGRMYGISGATVSAIHKRKIWSWLTENTP